MLMVQRLLLDSQLEYKLGVLEQFVQELEVEQLVVQLEQLGRQHLVRMALLALLVQQLVLELVQAI
jgi:hypothetical protein